MTWQQLKDTDIRVMDEVCDAAIRNEQRRLGAKKKAKELAEQTGEGRRVVSWIWQGAAGDIEEGNIPVMFLLPNGPNTHQVFELSGVRPLLGSSVGRKR